MLSLLFPEDLLYDDALSILIIYIIYIYNFYNHPSLHIKCLETGKSSCTMFLSAESFVPFVLVRHCVITNKGVVLCTCVVISWRKPFELGGFILQFVMK